MTLHGRAGLFVAGLCLAAACAAPGASPTAVTPTETPATAPTQAASPTQGGDAGDLLARIRQAGKIRISTDADYAPQSSVTETGDYEGFDIDTGEEIAERLGVEAEWSPQIWDTVIAGSWSERWDMSVGSITVTPEREELFAFTQPYYYTPAEIAVVEGAGITSIEDLAGKVACVGEDTTYLYWIEGTLNLGEGGEMVTEAPEGLTATTFETDANCAEALRAGRRDFEAFITAGAVIDEAIAAGTPLVKIGEPIFFEPLAVAFDKNGPPHAELLAEVDRILGEMHADGTLTEFSMTWYEEDLTKTD